MRGRRILHIRLVNPTTSNDEDDANQEVYMTWHLIWFLLNIEVEKNELLLDVVLEREERGVEEILQGGTESDALKQCFLTSKSFRNLLATLRWLRWCAKYQFDFSGVPLYNQEDEMFGGNADAARASTLSAGGQSTGSAGVGSTGDVNMQAQYFPSVLFARTKAANVQNAKMFMHPDASLSEKNRFDQADLDVEKKFLENLWNLLRVGDL